MNTHNDPRVGIAGDWHGNTRWALKVLAEYHDRTITTIYQVGDFGIWPGTDGEKYLHTLNAAATNYQQTIYVIPGNHEDYTRIATMTPDTDGWLHLPEYPALRFAPRGHTWTHAGVRYGALGGGGSVDRNLRIPGKSWWPEEEITDNNVHTLTANTAAHGWPRLDILLTHEAPAGVHRPGTRQGPWFTEDVAHDCWTQRVRLRNATDNTQPAWLIHGHWHHNFEDTLEGTQPNGQPYTTNVIGLSKDQDFEHAIIAETQPETGITDIEYLVIF